MKEITQEVLNTIAEEITSGRNTGEIRVDYDVISWDLSITHLSDIPY